MREAGVLVLVLSGDAVILLEVLAVRTGTILVILVVDVGGGRVEILCAVLSACDTRRRERRRRLGVVVRLCRRGEAIAWLLLGRCFISLNKSFRLGSERVGSYRAGSL